MTGGALDVLRWAWAVCAAVILVGAVLPADWLLGVAPRDSWSWVSTLIHGAEFAVLTALLAWRLIPAARSGGESVATAVAGACVAAFGLGILVELLQYPLPYRSFELWDLAADAAGVAFAAVAVTLAARGGVARRHGR